MPVRVFSGENTFCSFFTFYIFFLVLLIVARRV
uniref:Uncharacterized protein n=1 Tax=Anguilla anguilla TaxID=7936 RepID=A0A0E9TZZ4_ANGAN